MEQFNLDQVFSTILDTTSGFLCGVLPTEESIDFVRSFTDYLKAVCIFFCFEVKYCITKMFLLIYVFIFSEN